MGSNSSTQNDYSYNDNSNADFPEAAYTQAALALKLAYDQYKSYDRMVDKQDAIAQQIQTRANELHAAWSGTYFPRESQIVNEIYSQSEYSPQTELRSLEAQAEVARQFAIAKKNALYCLSVSCEGAVCDTERKLSIAEARAKAWQIQSAVRQEEAKADVKNAQIRSDKVQVLNLGRGHAAAAGTLLQAAANIYESVGAQSAAANNALASTLGGAYRQLTGPGANAQQPRAGASQQGTNYGPTDSNTSSPRLTSMNGGTGLVPAGSSMVLMMPTPSNPANQVTAGANTMETGATSTGTFKAPDYNLYAGSQ